MVGDIKKIEDRVRELCPKWGCTKQDENDVVQEVHLLMLEKPERKVDNATSQAIRRVCSNPALSAPDLPDETTPAQLAEDKEEHEQMMARLAPRDREVAGMLVDGYTISEIADKLGAKYKNLHRHLEVLEGKMRAGKALYPDHGGLFTPAGEKKVQRIPKRQM